MTVKFAHCLFEQSGTFRDAFRELGVPAKCYDIEDQFGRTDMKIDLFSQIERAYFERRSIFDTFTPEDLVLAFFPCTYFNESNEMFFCGTNYNFRQLTKTDVLDKIIERAVKRSDNYIVLLKLCWVIERRGLRMIVENPYNAHHFLRFNFPYKPAVIDMDRRRRGDYFPKPTQYLFVNCEPAGKKSLQMDKPRKFVNNATGIERSLISPDYAHNFICDEILGIDSGHAIPTLFDN